MPKIIFACETYNKIPVFGKDYIPVAENYIKLVPKCDDNYKILIEDHTSEDADEMTRARHY